jgi:hypothetical protein
MIIHIQTDVGETLELIKEVDSMELTIKKANGDMGHTSQLSMQDHIRALAISFDSMKTKASQLFKMASDNLETKDYAGIYERLFHHADQQQKLLLQVDAEMTKIARKELGEGSADDPPKEDDHTETVPEPPPAVTQDGPPSGGSVETA